MEISVPSSFTTGFPETYNFPEVSGRIPDIFAITSKTRINELPLG